MVLALESNSIPTWAPTTTSARLKVKGPSPKRVFDVNVKVVDVFDGLSMVTVELVTLVTTPVTNSSCPAEPISMATASSVVPLASTVPRAMIFAPTTTSASVPALPPSWYVVAEPTLIVRVKP